MQARGEIAVSAREGREPLWDLAERVYPDVESVELWEAAAERDRRLLRAVGIARANEYDGFRVHDAGVDAVVTGVKGRWRVDPELLDEPFQGRAAIVSPLDHLVFDRRRMEELFDFDYQLEMYKPAHTRQWGYWAMPMLYGDRLVGKLDAQSDRESGVLRVHALHADVTFNATMRRAFDDEIAGLAHVLGLEPAP